MTIQKSLQLFDLVNRNFKSESDARLFVTEIDELISSSFKEEASDLPTRQDLDVVKTELLKEIAAMNKETTQLRIDLVKEIAANNKETIQLRADLTKQIDSSKIELIKWMFSFWITIVFLIIGAFIMKKQTAFLSFLCFQNRYNLL